ncbi:MAG: DNA topoisomerase [Clostridia bacterium]|nr:DNA topoisomerase [Clostridia bacterium]
MAEKKYNDQTISSLKGADRVRKRPAVIFGSEGLEGCEHSFFEILSNSIDEAREGYGKEIVVTVYQDRTIEVDDHGRGVPLDFNKKENRYNWELVYCELYAGGKYNNNQDSSAYKYSLGLNGLGACATQYSSEFMDVYSFKGDTMYEIHFEKGNPVSELISSPLERKHKRTGTLTRWRPDLEVFTDTCIPKEHYLDILHKQAVVNKGLRLVLVYEEENGSLSTTDFFYENGISDYINELTENKPLTPPYYWEMSARGKDREDKDEYELKAEVSFCVSNLVNGLEYYHNSSFLEHGGSPDKAVKRAFLLELDKYLKDNGKYNKSESKISFVDIQDCLVLVINSFSTQTSYENQTKKSITNKFIEDALCDSIRTNLQIYFAENPMQAELFANQVLVNKRSRERAESTRIDLKKKLATSTDIANRVEKFVSCRSKDPDVRELYIVEGDSALTSCKLARNAEFQAIIPVRGKTLNCLKSSYDKIFKSDIIVDLLKVIGCGVEVQTKSKGKDEMSAFNLANLRWSKIIICTDADEDGFQIRTLLLTMFYRLLPTLIKEGKIFIAESPLYEITSARDEIYFAYNEAEKTEILASLEGKKYTIQRSKGLGENEPDMMSKTTMRPDTRRLIQVSPTDEEATRIIFETLLGDDIVARKQFIADNGYRYMDIADI